MAKYTLFLSQMGRDPMDGGGRLIALAATTVEDARVEARGHYRSDEDIVVDKMSILEISSIEEIDVDAIAAAKEAEKAARDKARAEAHERAELDRLKRKFEGA